MQAEGDLGARMEHAFQKCFARGHDRVLIIGSDCPGVTTAYLRRAYAALEQTDVVVGPAADGGYTLLGMRELLSPLFRDMTWSTASVLPETLARVAAQGRSVTQLATLIDVDHIEDWHSYGWTLPN